MKPTTSSLMVTLSFLLWFCFTTTKPSSLASAAEPVVDGNGDPLVPGQKYYLRSIISVGGRTDAVAAERTGSSSCSYTVIVRRSFDFKGDPVKFRIPRTSTGTIYENSTLVEIEFADKPQCGRFSEWAAAFESGSSSSPTKLVIGGPEDHPNSFLVSGYFQIEKVTLIGYKLVFCPKIVHSFSVCYTVGLGEGWQLTLKDRDESGFLLGFRKAEDFAKGMSII